MNSMQKKQPTFYRLESNQWAMPNYWDAIAFGLMAAFLALLVWGASRMAAPYHLGQPIPIHLDWHYLPYYALRSSLRMLIAMICSLVFTFVVGAWAAKRPLAERVIIPLIDVLQSVPILSFLSISIVGFIWLFPNRLFGVECASIFAIFTSQVWNMTLSFYQSLKTVPHDLQEASQMLRLSGWRKFWRVEVPFAMPGLIWNMMMSMSASWFFVVASEAISVANQSITLPGIGSYIALAISQANKVAIVSAIVAMFCVILLYDQCLFRPLSAWTDQFKFETDDESDLANSWLVELFQRTRLVRQFNRLIAIIWDRFVGIVWLNKLTKPRHKMINEVSERWLARYFLPSLLYLTVGFMLYHLGFFLYQSVSLDTLLHVGYLGCVTGLKVAILIILSVALLLPLGVWIGQNARVTAVAQPMIQFLAAFPANLFFPLVVIAIVRYHLNVNVWTAPLMVLGTMWYVLFNVIAGMRALPKDIQQAARNLQVTGWLRWRTLILPGVFPYLVTGCITAAGGAWNASIVAEVVAWGSHHLVATGLGAYITESTIHGDFHHLWLGTLMMCAFVVLINRFLWQPLYRLAQKRYQI